MSSNCKHDVDVEAEAPDRYKSFSGIDCAGNARRLMAYIDHHTTDLKDDKLWRHFHSRRQSAIGVQADDLLLLASFVNPIRELFEAKSDEQGLALLDQLEDECF